MSDPLKREREAVLEAIDTGDYGGEGEELADALIAAARAQGRREVREEQLVRLEADLREAIETIGKMGGAQIISPALRNRLHRCLFAEAGEGGTDAP